LAGVPTPPGFQAEALHETGRQHRNAKLFARSGWSRNPSASVFPLRARRAPSPRRPPH